MLIDNSFIGNILLRYKIVTNKVIEYNHKLRKVSDGFFIGVICASTACEHLIFMEPYPYQ